MGHSNFNVVTLLMRERNLTLQSAADAVGAEFSSMVSGFQAGKREIRSWGGTVDKGVQYYIGAMETWADGYLKWCFLSRRYFGSQIEEVKKTGVVYLKPSVVTQP